MNRQEILKAAEDCVCRDRQATHGAPENSFGKLAAVWSARLGVTLQGHQVAIMLMDLKTARAWDNELNKDNWVDMAGYAACGGEVAAKEYQALLDAWDVPPEVQNGPATVKKSLTAQPQSKEPEAKPKFAVGQVWEARNGKNFTITRISSDAGFPIRGKNNSNLNVCWSRDGMYYTSDGGHDYDLVQLVSEPDGAA